MPIVVIPMNDDLAQAQVDAAVPLGTKRDRAVRAKVADARVARHAVFDRIGTIVENDQLTVWVVLVEKAVDRTDDEVAAVTRGHDAGDERAAVVRHRTHSAGAAA